MLLDTKQSAEVEKYVNSLGLHLENHKLKTKNSYFETKTIYLVSLKMHLALLISYIGISKSLLKEIRIV